VIGISLPIFPVRARFRIVQAVKRLHALMMRAHLEPIDDATPGLITESYDHLPHCRRVLVMWNSCQRFLWLELANARLLVYVLATP
jgi:hypothetical protein